MIIRDRTDEQIQQDAVDLCQALSEIRGLALAKNSGDGYAGTWACADLRLRFADVHRKFVRLLAQVWRRPPEKHNLPDIRETYRDLAVYSLLGLIETDRLALGYYKVSEGYDGGADRASCAGHRRDKGHRARNRPRPA